MTRAVKRLIRDAAARIPELSHVRASRILVVAGEARRASRATIRPARGRDRPGGGKRPIIRVHGREILYVVTLRPLWFLESTALERVTTIVHELYHTSNRFDGTLHRGRRHSRLPLPVYNRKIRVLVRRYLAVAPEEILAPLSALGTARARMWLERPATSNPEDWRGRHVYTERQLFYGPVRMVTRRKR